MLTLAKAPAIDRQRHQSFFRAHRSIRRLSLSPYEQLLLAEAVHAAVPVDEKQTRRRRLPPLRNEEQRGDGLEAVQVQLQPLDRVSFAPLGLEQLRRARLVVPGQVA